MLQRASEVFLGRQPILDRRRNIVAYELLFRSGPVDEALFGDGAAATDQVIRQAFRQAGIRTLVGDRPAFVNVDAPTLLGAGVEALPREQVVIELLETIVIDDAIVARCRDLKAQGFRLALDDIVRCEAAHEPLLDLVDIVKIDVLQLDPERLATLVRRLRRWPPRLLAEKVETLQGARACLDLGFSLFQGFYFGRPATLTL